MNAKREIDKQAPAFGEPSASRPGETSAEAALYREIAELGMWLADQGVDVAADNGHRDAGSRDQLYWRFGYFAGMKKALSMLTRRGATLH